MRAGHPLLWSMVLLALCALAGRFLLDRAPGPRTLDPRAQAALRSMCDFLDGLTTFQVDVVSRSSSRRRKFSERRYRSPLEPAHPDAGPVRLEVVERRYRALLTPRTFQATTSDGGVIQCTAEGGTFRLQPHREGTWRPEVAGTLRQAAGTFLGVPGRGPGDLPGRHSLDIPYSLGGLVQTDSWSYMVVGVTGSADQGIDRSIEEAGGPPCRRFSFYQDGLDWDLWLPVAGPPAPHRISIRWQGREGPRFVEVRYENWRFEE